MSEDVINQKILSAIALLSNTYESIPRTRGCGQACSKNGCKAWCCSLQTPSMFKVEFLYLWSIFSSVSEEVRKEILFNSIRNYLSNSLIKGCVLFDKATCKCFLHKNRPLMCRLYSIIHPDSWKSKIDNFKKNNADISSKDRIGVKKILKQCDLVETVDGRDRVSVKEENDWFEKTKEAEKLLGIDEKKVENYGAPDSSYHTLHDHIMLVSFSEDMLHRLSQNRMDKLSKNEIEELIVSIKKSM